MGSGTLVASLFRSGGLSMYKVSGLAAMMLAAFSASAQSGPYAGQQQRDIKSLPAAEVAQLLAGEGMGLAKAAELNGYPGPAHVLEHADALALTPEQKQASQVLMDRHMERARRLGATLVVAERALDQAFAGRQIDEASLARLTAEIGAMQAQLREEHLRTHLAQTAILSAGQIRQYAQLRGYLAPLAAPASSAHPRRH
jgi:Spy/CpxP family protein refolding chaperone